ncbi:MAG TPA: hypothetical protein VND94_16330 [Terriglobia bacterium]|nr:hypothetical protein [Terriglobia bacterium]
MDAIAEFSGRHGGALLAIAVLIAALGWIWVLLTTARFGHKRYGMRMIRCWSMALLAIAFILLIAGGLTMPRACAAAGCDLSSLQSEHYLIYLVTAGLGAIGSLAINIHRGGALFGSFFTFSQMTIVFVSFFLIFFYFVLQLAARSDQPSRVRA